MLLQLKLCAGSFLAVFHLSNDPYSTAILAISYFEQGMCQSSLSRAVSTLPLIPAMTPLINTIHTNQLRGHDAGENNEDERSFDAIP